MALPVPVKTWLISPNNTLPSNVGPADPQGRARDLADFFGTVVTQLLALSATLPTPITVAGSSDGTSNTSPPTIPSANYWVPGSAVFKQNLYDYFGSGSASSLWVVLQFGPSQLAFCFERATSQFTARWSETGAFVAPVASNLRPTAIDEVLLFYTSAGFFGTYGNFNMDGQGIINSSNSYLNYAQQVQIGLANDLSCFYVVSYRSQAVAQIIWFGTMQNAVIAPPYDWSAAKVMFMSGNLRFRQYGGQYSESTGNGWQPRATLDSNGVFLLPPVIPNNGFNSGGGGGGVVYQDVPLNALMFNGTVDLDTNAFPLSNVSVYSPARYGLKGVLTDVWFGPANGNTYTYPASAPLAPDLFQANDLVLPWDGTTTILFA